MRIIFIILLPFFFIYPSSAQIEDPELINKILSENYNLGALYKEYPNAMKIYKESIDERRRGWAKNTLGAGVFTLGIYNVYKGITASTQSNSGFLNVSILGSGKKTGRIIVGSVLTLIGATFINSGFKNLKIANIMKDGSVQQYIWDSDYKASIRKDTEVLYFGFQNNGVGFNLVF